MKLYRIASMLLLLLIVGILLFRKEKQTIMLDYWEKDNILVSDMKGMEILYYHATNPNTYCFTQKTFQVCFRKHR